MITMMIDIIIMETAMTMRDDTFYMRKMVNYRLDYPKYPYSFKPQKSDIGYNDMINIQIDY